MFEELDSNEIRNISGGGPLAAIAGGIFGCLIGCIAVSINAIARKDHSTKSLVEGLVAFTTLGAGIGMIAPCI